MAKSHAVIYQVAAVSTEGRFQVIRQPLHIDPKEQTKCYCETGRGIYLIQSDLFSTAFLLPERVELTVKAARELLNKDQLPAPRILQNEVIEELNQALETGECWDSATGRLGLGPSGNGNRAHEIQN